MLKKAFIIAACSATALLASCNHMEEKVEETNITFSDVAVETMDEMIQVIREKHFGDEGNKVDWAAVREKHLSRVKASRDISALKNNLEAIVSEIKHSHVAIMEPENELAIQRLKAIINGDPLPPEPELSFTPPAEDLPATPPGELGIRIGRTTEGKLRIAAIQPGSIAARGKLHVGDEVTAIQSSTPSEIPSFIFTPSFVENKPDIPWFTVTQMVLAGPSETKVHLTVVPYNNPDTVRKLTFKRKPNGLRWTKLGVMPAEAGGYLSYMDADKIGFIAFTPCMPSQIAQCRKDIRKFAAQGMKGLILDFRGNPGGLGVMTSGILGLLISEKQNYLYEVTKFRTAPTYAYAQKNPYLGPVAILTDKGSGSSSEIISAAIQDLKRGKIFGKTTAGACLGSNFIELKSGFRLQTVLSDCIRLNGKPLEKLGVTPDVDVDFVEESLVKGYDPVEQAARKYLKDNEGFIYKTPKTN